MYLSFLKQSKEHIKCMCGNKDRYVKNNKYAITTNNIGPS